ncbi:MAG: hypothetical protein AAF393_18020, partial [Pseudomonadota bacterium]
MIRKFVLASTVLATLSISPSQTLAQAGLSDSKSLLNNIAATARNIETWRNDFSGGEKVVDGLQDILKTTKGLAVLGSALAAVETVLKIAEIIETGPSETDLIRNDIAALSGKVDNFQDFVAKDLENTRLNVSYNSEFERLEGIKKSTNRNLGFFNSKFPDPANVSEIALSALQDDVSFFINVCDTSDDLTNFVGGAQSQWSLAKKTNELFFGDEVLLSTLSLSTSLAILNSSTLYAYVYADTLRDEETFKK